MLEERLAERDRAEAPDAAKLAELPADVGRVVYGARLDGGNLTFEFSLPLQMMRAILETGYTGYVAQEFIPTWPDKLSALRHGVRVCDV